MVLISIALAALAMLAIGPSPQLLAPLALAAVAPPLFWTDVTQHRLPNRLTLPALGAGLIGAGVSWLATGGLPLVPLLAGIASFVVFLLLALAGGMGMGDVKLAAAIGLASPTLTVAVAAPLIAFLLGGVASLVVLARGGWSARQSHLPFGPFLLLGYATALAVGAVARAGAG